MSWKRETALFFLERGGGVSEFRKYGLEALRRKRNDLYREKKKDFCWRETTGTGCLMQGEKGESSL